MINLLNLSESQFLLSNRSKTTLFVVLSLSFVQLFVTPWTAAHQALLSFTVSQSFLKFMSIKSVMLSNYLIFCCPLLLLPSLFPSIRVFSNGSALHIRWPKYWSFSFCIATVQDFQSYSGIDFNVVRKGHFNSWSPLNVQQRFIEYLHCVRYYK